MTRIVLALVCAVLSLAPHAWAAEEKRVALVMGVGAYAQLRPLTNPRNDVRLIAEKLKALGFEVEAVLDPDRAEMADALGRFDDRSHDAPTST